MNYTRRDALRLGLCGLGIGMSASLLSCAGLRRADLPAELANSEEILSFLTPDRQAILHHAGLAPSGHNSQPWRVVVEDSQTWRLELDTQRGLPAVDPDFRESLLSLGAFLENLTQAAAAFGLAADVEFLSQTVGDTAVARIHLSQSATAPLDRHALRRIAGRRTLKNGQLRKELNAEEIRLLQADYGNGLIYVPYNAPMARRLEDGIVSSMTEQCHRREAMREFAHWVRFSKEEALRERDGLTTEGMEIQGLAGWAVRTFFTKEDATSPSFIEKTIDKTAEQARSGGGFLLLFADGTTAADLLSCGRRFERMFLSLRERKLALHPMSAPLEESQGRQDLAGILASDSSLPNAAAVQFILCVGYVDDYPLPVSPAPPAWALCGGVKDEKRGTPCPF